jgi:type IV secretory pathway VirB4 component
LAGPGYAQLAHRCWAPELARAQRFQREIGDYTGLVVSSDRSARGSKAGAQLPSGSEPRDPRTRRGLSRDERLLALGARTLADLIAPGACDVREDHLQLDGQYARVLAITAYPRTVTAGWLAPLVESDLPIEVSIHVRPLDSAATVRALSTHIARLQAGRLARLRGERVADPERDIALEDAERLRERLQRGEERVFSASLYILVRARIRAELDALTRRVETLLDGMLAHSRRLRYQQEPGFRSCLPEGRDQLLVTRNLDTSTLAATLPFVGSSLSMERGVLYGISARTQSPIIVDPFDDRFDNYHLAVMAPSGSGKSYFVKLLALRSLINGTDYLVIDPEDEYRRVAEAVGGQMVRLAPSSRQQINPLDLVLPEATAEIGGPAGALAEAIGTVVSRLELLLCAGMGAGGAPGLLDTDERAVLDRALHQTYAAAGITPDTAGQGGPPAPLLAALHATLDSNQGDLAARLARRLERHARAGLFSGPTSVALDGSLVVFQIRDLPEEFWPLAVHWIGGHIWSVARRYRKPRRLVVDEAATLLAHPSGGAFLAQIARRARKHYLGLVTLTQKVGDLTGCEHGDTILTNAAMKLLLKQTSDIIDAADARFRFTWEERRWLLGASKGEGLLLVGNERHQIRIVPSRAEDQLITTNPRELAELGTELDPRHHYEQLPVGASNGRAA